MCRGGMILEYSGEGRCAVGRGDLSESGEGRAQVRSDCRIQWGGPMYMYRGGEGRRTRAYSGEGRCWRMCRRGSGGSRLGIWGFIPSQ